MESQIVAVAGFASGWMLLWGVAATIPIILHYLYRRRQVTVPWAAMQLLLQVIEKESKRINLEQWLLLLVRTLVLLLLAISLARPFWSTEASDSATGDALVSTSWILAIDVSYSMGYRADNETRLQSAQRRAAEIIETASAGDAFALVALGKPPRAVISSPSFDRGTVLTELGRLTIDDAGCDLRSGLQLLDDMATKAQQNESLPAHIRVILLSDLGLDQWQLTVDGAEAKLLREQMDKYMFEIESFSDEAVSNVAITAIRPSTTRTILGQPLEVDVDLKNFGEGPVEQLPVQLLLDGSTVASQVINIASGGAQTVRFTQTVSNPGIRVLSATIPADRLPVDNTRSHVIDVRDEHQLLFVEQQAGDARILELALEPDKRMTLDRNRSTASVLELSSIDLTKLHGIVLVDLPEIGEQTFGRLASFVRGGGALVCLFGPRADAEQWNLRDTSESLLGFRLLEPTAANETSPQAWAIDPLEYKSPIVAPFAGFPDAGLLTTPIFRLWRIAPNKTQASNWGVDLAIEQGAPLVVHHRLGQGAVVSLLSTPQSGSETAEPWNAMATWPSFVPLLQMIVQFAMDSGTQHTTVLAGQALMGKLYATQLTSSMSPTNSHLLTITKPDSTERQIVVGGMQADNIASWTFADTHQSGVYVARSAVNNEQQYFSVNVDGSESSLQSISPDQLPKSQFKPAPLTEARGTGANVTESSGPTTRFCLVSLGLLMALESLLAWILGRREA